MSMTPILSFQQVYSGTAPPTVGAGLMPENPAETALYVQFVAGVPASQYAWDVTTMAWVALPAPGYNWSRVEGFGWTGKHNNAHRPSSPAHTQLDQPCVYFPTFSVDEPSTSAVDFTIKDMITGATLATGSFPALQRTADSAAVSLVDTASVGVTSFSVPASTVMQFAAVPTGGHGAMPADGLSFHAQGFVVF